MATSPDTYPRPYADYFRNARPTPTSLGAGAGEPRPEPAADGLGALVARPGPAADPRATAAWQRAHEQAMPRTIRLFGSATATTGTPTVIDLGGPKAGHVWQLRRINVGPVDYTNTSYPTGITVIAIIGANAGPGPASAAASAGQVLSETGAFPAEGTWSREEATLLAGDRLRVIVLGLTTGYVVTAGGQAIQTAEDTTEVYAL